jgi:hypothetical protein
MNIQPSIRTNRKSLCEWEVLDNKNKVVGSFSANKDKDGKEYAKLLDICKASNIAHDLFDIRQRIKDLIHGKNDWQINDRALQACDQTRQALSELDAIINHIKQS